jgi:hypothetical protein
MGGRQQFASSGPRRTVCTLDANRIAAWVCPGAKPFGGGRRGGGEDTNSSIANLLTKDLSSLFISKVPV